MRPDRSSPPASDTIVAIATPPGISAIGVIRISGDRAIEVASTVIRLVNGSDLRSARPGMVYRAHVADVDASTPLDLALATVMPQPRSYTGEDVVEISCHGNPVVLDRVVRRLLSNCARLAQPGEFTRRAYLNGRIDLTQAEAVGHLIGARTERAVRLAARELTGGISTSVHEVRNRLLDLIAGLEVGLDFPEDEIGVSRPVATESTRQLAGCLQRMTERSRAGRQVHLGLRVVLAGAPNVGKSSLLNALLGRERAIVSPVPGTTRDLVEGEIVIRGVPVLLVDGAGLGSPRDALDAEAMRRSRGAIDQADLLVIVLDRSRPLTEEDRHALSLPFEGSRLVVANKADLDAAFSGESTDCACSALTGAGLDRLRDRLEEWVEGRTKLDGDEGGVVASLRVLEQLERGRTALEEAGRALDADVAVEAVLVDLRLALAAMDQILGGGIDDAVLDRIFSTFCVGK